MNYFQVLCYGLGGLVILSSFWISLAPGAYKQLALKMLPEKRVSWMVPLCLAWLVLIAYTWFQYFQFPTVPTFIVAFILSLGLIKLYAIFFNYEGYRSFALSFIDSPPIILRVIGLVYLALGSLLIAVGLLL